MTHGCTVLCQKDQRKSNSVRNIVQSHVSHWCEALNRSDSWRDVWLSWTGDQLLIDGTVRTVTLVRIVHFFSTDIEMEVGMKKCGILTIKRGKVVRCEGL